MKKAFIAGLLAAAAAPAAATPVTINFDAIGNSASTYTESGYTFAIQSPGYSPGNDSNMWAYLGGIQITSAAGLFDFISFDLTHYHQPMTVTSNNGDTLTFSEYGVRMVNFFGVSSILITSAENDDFEIDTVTVADAIPEPAMLGLFGLGAIGLGLSRRRKS